MTDEPPLIEALGLSQDPFARPRDTFFPAGDRTRQLDELRQLSRGTRRLLAVTGDLGVGKSVMFRTLSNRLAPGVKAARINATLVNDLRSMLQNVLQGLGLAQPDSVKPETLADAIVEHARTQGAAGRYCLVLVDDAHALELRALEILLKMLEATPDRGLRIVFFAETQFVQSLDKAIRRAAPSLTWHEIRLTPFSRDEVRRYLRFRLEEAGWEDHLPFTEAQIQELIIDAGGFPGAIDGIASRLLTRDSDSKIPPMFPPLHRALLYLLLVVVGMTSWLIWRSDGDDAAPGPVASVPPETPPDPGPDPGAKVATVDRSPIDEEPPDDSLPLETETVADPALDSEKVPDVTPLLGAEPADPVEEVDAVEAPEEDSVDPEPRLTEESAPDFAGDSTGEGISDPVTVAEPDPVVQEPKPVVREPDPVVLEPSPIPEARPEPPPAQPRVLPAPEPAVDPPVARVPALRPGAKGAGWVMRQPPDRYTLQLFGTANRARMVEYINRQLDLSEFALLTLNRDGQPWFVITYGVFSSSGAARSAIQNLPNTIGRVDPWVRSFESIQTHINESR